MALWWFTRNSLLKQERFKWGQGDVPLGLPPPLGERGGHPHSLSKRIKSERISTDPKFLKKISGI
jgi:hypothetical protein